MSKAYSYISAIIGGIFGWIGAGIINSSGNLLFHNIILIIPLAVFGYIVGNRLDEYTEERNENRIQNRNLENKSKEESEKAEYERQKWDIKKAEEKKRNEEKRKESMKREILYMTGQVHKYLGTFGISAEEKQELKKAKEALVKAQDKIDIDMNSEVLTNYARKIIDSYEQQTIWKKKQQEEVDEKKRLRDEEQEKRKREEDDERKRNNEEKRRKKEEEKLLLEEERRQIEDENRKKGEERRRREEEESKRKQEMKQEILDKIYEIIKK